MELLRAAGYFPIQYARYDCFHNKKQDLEHCAWMCKRIIETVEADELTRKDFEKINRWPGFIRGVFAARRFRLVDEMKHDNRGDKE